MSSPFSIFRKHQKILLVVLIGLSMLSFVILGTVQQASDIQGMPPTLVVLTIAALVASIAWVIGLTNHKSGEYGSIGLIAGVAIGLVFVMRGGEPDAVTTNKGNLDRNELIGLMNDRGTANQFIAQAVSRTFDMPDFPEQLRRFINPQQILNERIVGFQFGFETRQEITERDVLLGDLLRREADAIGFSLPDQAVTDYINLITQSKMTPAIFREIRSEMGVSEQDITEAIRRELVAQKTAEMLFGGVDLPPEVYWDFSKRLQVRETATAAALPVKAFIDAKVEPPVAELQELFARYRTNPPGITPDGEREEGVPGFRQPDRLRMAYLQADYESFEKQVEPQITDAEIQARYERDYLLKPSTNELFPGGPSFPGGPMLPGMNTPPFAPGEGVPPAPGESNLPPAAPTGTPPAAPPAGTTTPPAAETPALPPAPATPAPSAEPPMAPPAANEPAPPPATENPPSCDDAAAETQTPPAATETPTPAPAPAPATEATPPAADTSAPPATPPATPPAGTPPATPPATTLPGEAASPFPAPQIPGLVGPGAGSLIDSLVPPTTDPRPLDDQLKQVIRDQLLAEKTAAAIEQSLEKALEDLRALKLSLHVKAPASDPDRLTSEQALEKLKQYAAQHNLKYEESPLLSFDELMDSDDYPVARAIRPRPDSQFEFQTVAEELFSTSRNDLFTFRQVERTGRLGQTSEHYIYCKVEQREGYVPEDMSEPRVRDQVVNTWRELKAREVAQKRAQAIAEQVRASDKPMMDTLADATVTGSEDADPLIIRRTGQFPWMRQSTAPSLGLQQQTQPPELSQPLLPERVGEDFMHVVFDELDVGDVGVAPNEEHTVYYAVKIESRIPGTPEEWEIARTNFLAGGSQNDTALRMMARELRAETVPYWPEQLFKKYDVQFLQPIQSVDSAG